MIKRTIPMLLVLGLSFLITMACGPAKVSTDIQPASPSTVPRAPAEEPDGTGGSDGSDTVSGREVFVSLQDPAGSGTYAYGPEDFTFSIGEVITFVLESETEFHTFTVSELDLNVSVPGGVTAESSFTFDKAGTYTLICIPHEALGMVGTITVQ